MSKEKLKDESKLGFGLMRLPKLENGKIDVEQTKEMVDKFMDAGFTYFDTAYVYDQGESEAVAKEALVDRYPRDSYTLATKLNAWLGEPTKEEAKKQFYTSLERTGAGYFDYYLLHAIQNNNRHIYDEYGLWDFVKELKDKGLIKHYGFSYHSGPELLDELLTEHPDVDFVQLQLNYADWENPRTASRENYEVVRKHGKPIVIMEPIKGGKLIDLEDNVKEVFDEELPEESPASLALRFVGSLDGILSTLSGMSNLDQMEDNIEIMKDFKPLTEEEQEVFKKAQKLFETSKLIPCTACHYCTDNCPQDIPIPEILSAYNKLYTNREEAIKEYQEVTENRGKAGDCIKCLQCEGACPQQLTITEFLDSASRVFD